MNIANKIFRNNRTGETIKVIDSFEDIAVLENKQKINVKTLMDTNQYTEQIDPSDFFNTQTAYDGLVEKIKSIPTDNMVDESVTKQIGSDPTFKPAIEESAVIQTTEEDEKAELAKKYGAQMDNQNDAEKQKQAFDKILNPEKNQSENTTTTRVEVNNQKQQEVNREYQQATVQKVEDPIISMFRNTKRNVNFNVSIDIENKIPRLDFIEMLEDSYEISIIDFLADEFTNKILNDPSSIKENIKSEITKLVYGEDSKNIESSETKQKKNSKPNAKKRIESISKMKEISEIEKFLKSEKAKTVIKAGNKRIEYLKNNN